MKVALIHDWLVNYGGAERCLEVFLEMYPASTVFTSVYDPKKLSAPLKNIDVRTSFIQNLPFSRTKYMNYLPLMPGAFESFDLGEYDLIISISHAVAKGVKKNKNALHVCYCLTPMRYAWDMREDYSKYKEFNFIRQTAFNVFMKRFRDWDIKSCSGVDEFVAISDFVRQRIQKYYGRHSEVIYPPVETEIFVPGAKDEDYYLVVSRLVPQKRIDIIVAAFNVLGLPLKIIGEGREEKALKKAAKSNIEFMGALTDKGIAGHLAGCKALVFASLEDFGITPLEAQSAGRPVIALGKGGALETVINGKAGVYFYEQTPEAVVLAVRKFETMRFDKSAIRNNAKRFSREIFKEKISGFINAKIREYQGNIKK